MDVFLDMPRHHQVALVATLPTAVLQAVLPVTWPPESKDFGRLTSYVVQLVQHALHCL